LWSAKLICCIWELLHSQKAVQLIIDSKFVSSFFAEDDPDDVDFEPDSETDKTAVKVIYQLEFSFIKWCVTLAIYCIACTLNYIMMLLFRLAGAV
jgi:hypothetical protein